jgi:N-acetylmuramoyl-L-alanine amidase
MQRSQIDMKLRIIALTILTLILSPVLKSNHLHFNLSNKSLNNNNIFKEVDAILRLDGGIKKVVLDAGHGGHDSGCHGKNSLEKELALKIVLKLGEQIESNFPDIEVIYTRKTDVFVPLYERIGLANKKNADLFISVHCNWISNGNTRGTETFVMGLHRAAENLNVAKRENESILLESDFYKNYDGFDPNSPVGHIMLSVYQDAYLSQSIKLASAVERNLKSKNYTKSRGVKQAGFAVLRRATMPSILIETGFLSNKDEESFLASEKGQIEVASSIFNAFVDYAEISNSSSNSAKVIAKVSSKDVKTNIPSGTVSNSQTKSDVIVMASSTKDLVMSSGEKIITQESIAPQESIYRIQIAALNTSISKAIQNDKSLAMIGSLNILQVNSMYKFQVGDFKTLDQALQAKEQLLALGYKNAFLTQYAK